MTTGSPLPDYDLTDLQIITPMNRSFRMFITQRYFGHYVDNAYEEYTSDLLLKYVKDGSVFIDIGAHYGYYTLLIGTHKPNCRILSFEPVPENFAILSKNIELNKLTNVTAYKSAVSNKSGAGAFHITEASDNCGFHGHPVSGDIKEIEVETVELDSLLQDLRGRDVTIKIDTEGHDIHVLEGMQSFLKENDNVKLVVEFNPKCIVNAGYDPIDLLNKIASFDFDIYFILDDKRIFYKLDLAKIGQWPDYMRGYEKSYLNIFCIKKTRSLSICFFSHLSDLMGAERSMLELVKELIEDHGALVSVILPNEGPLTGKLLDIGAAVVVAGYNWWCNFPMQEREDADTLLVNSYLNVFRLSNGELGKVNPDVIITNTIVIPWGALAAAMLGKPHIWFIREFGELDYKMKFSQPFKDTLNIVRESSNFIFTTSKAVKDLLFGDVDNKNILPVYTYFDLAPETINKTDISYFKRKDAIKLIIFGSVAEHKGQLDAILAVKELAERKENVELLIVGPGTGDYIEILKELIARENLHEYVKILGWLEDVFPTVIEADVVLVCSRYEAFGRVTAEAMMLKKPVIGTYAGGTAELIQHGYNGLLYTHGDYKQLASHIKYFIDNKEKIIELGENGYHFAKKTFTRDKFGGTVHKLAYQLKKSGNPLESSYNRFALRIFLNTIEILENTCQSQIAELNSALIARDNQIGELSAAIQARDALIHQIMSGIVMRLMTKFKKIVEKILPSGTKRYQSYQLMLDGVHVTVNEGWGSFWKRFARWLRFQK